MDKYSGKRLDARYEIQELIGVGGMAYVYKAYDIIDDRTVAIKILKEEFLGNQDFLRRFKNESKAIAMLDHPNIVKVFSVSFGDRMQYIVMEYIDGISLKEYLDRQTEVRWKEAIHFTVQILKALQHAHENGIIHRDIKPQNIMLLQDGTIKVTDFGIARFSDSETRTMTDKAIGSVHYIAPEQARGDLTDGKTDIYSVGVMLYEMITGQLPFEAENAVSVAIMQLQNDPKPPREINPAVPIGLEEITLKAMQKHPRQRYGSAREMLNDINAFRQDPNIRFYYEYTSVEEEPTRVVETGAFVTEKPAAPPPTRATVSEVQRYGDNYAYDSDEEEETSKKKTGLIVGISAGAAAAVAAIVLILCFVFGVFGGGGDDEVDLPNFVGQTLEEVQNNAEYKNFQFKVEYTFDNEAQEGVVVRQNPNGQIKVKKTSEIQLYVSSGKEMLDIPDVKDKKENDAVNELIRAGFKTEVKQEVSESVESGRVIRTNPETGSKAPRDSTITVYVSSGKEKVKVPSVTGDTLEQAKKKITDAGLQVGEVTNQKSDEVAKDRVISTSPAMNMEVEKDSKVNIVISDGPNVSDVYVEISLPSGVSGSMSMSVFLDGDSYHSASVTSDQGSYSLKVTGKGTRTLTVQLDDQLYAEYQLDFDNGTVRQTGSYQYRPGNGSGYNGYIDPDVTDDDYGNITN